MHKDDQMTPMERLNGFLTGGEMDRVLAMPLICSMSGKAAGMTHKQKRATGESEALCQIANYERFGNDLLICEYGLHTVGKSMGSVMGDPEDAVPHIQQHLMSKVDEVDKLNFELALPENSAECQKHLECTKILVDRLGQEVPTGALISGPFTAVASLLPVEKLLRATRKNPEGVHYLMRQCTEVLKKVHEAFIAEGAMVLFCEPIATGSIANPKEFVEFVLPYTIELMDNIHAHGGMVCYHICGDTKQIIKYMIESKPDMISIDNRVSLAYAKDLVQPYMPLVGNVDPVEKMILGTPEEVDEAVKECIKVGYDCEHGYVLSTGCDLNGNVPLENLDAFMAAARKYGKMPMGPANWE